MYGCYCAGRGIDCYWASYGRGLGFGEDVDIDYVGEELECVC